MAASRKITRTAFREAARKRVENWYARGVGVTEIVTHLRGVVSPSSVYRYINDETVPVYSVALVIQEAQDPR